MLVSHGLAASASQPAAREQFGKMDDDEAFELLGLASRPQGTPPPGAQLRFTDIDGHRFTCFATDAKRGQLADLELRHRRAASQSPRPLARAASHTQKIFNSL